MMLINELFTSLVLQDGAVLVSPLYLAPGTTEGEVENTYVSSDGKQHVHVYGEHNCIS